MFQPLSSTSKASSDVWRRRIAPLVDLAVVVGLTAIGILCPQGPAAFYRALFDGFAGIALAVVSGAAITTVSSERLSERLQGPRRRPTLAWRGARDTTLAAWIAACLLAWPLARIHAHEPNGLNWSLAASGGALRVSLQTLGAVLFLDAWLYWKHRLLHTRWLFAFHRAHHVYRDPTALAGFAVGPVESLLTFWPIVLVAVPQATHYGPLYLTLVVLFVLLNFYLHCGVAMTAMESTLPRLFINTSAFHNRHHANAEVNFGEALTLWDHLCRTREEDRLAEASQGRARPAHAGAQASGAI